MALDEADKKYIAELLAGALKPETIGAAVKAHVDAAVKPLQDRLDAGEKAAKDAKEAAEKAGKPADDGKGKDGKGKDADPETAKELAALRARLEASDKAREEAENRSKTEARDNATREALAKAGIPADRLPHAMAFLGTQGVIADKDGKVGWKGKDRFGVDAVLPLEEGAKAWASTPDGKLYLPPSGVQGTGTGAGNGGGSGQNGPKKLGDINVSRLFT